MSTRAAILARVSNDQGGRSASVDEQVTAGQRVISGLSWTLAGVYADSDISASRFANGKERPGWARLQQDIEAGLLDVVMLWSTSRASREMHDWSGFLNRCRRHGVRVHVITDAFTYDPAKPRDRKSLLEDGIDAEYESEKRSTDVRRGVQGALAAGKPVASVPYGYLKTRDPGNGKVTGLAIDPERGPKVRALFFALATCQPVSHSARAAGISRQTALYVARNPAYIAKRKLEDGTLVDCRWQPLVTEDVFWAVQENLAGHRGAGRKPGGYRSLLAFLAVCGHCGRPITTERRRGVMHYRCQKGCTFYRGSDEANFRVELDLARLLEQPGVIERFMPEPGQEGAAARTEAAQLRQRLDDASRSYAVGRIPITALESIERELRPKVKAAEDRAAKAATVPALAPFMTRERAGQVWNIIQEMDLHQLREVIRATCVIEFRKGRVVEVMLR